MKFEELHNGELCLFMSETGTFMSTGENDDIEETFRKLLSVLLSGFISMQKGTQFDIEQILLIELEALKEVREELSDVHPIEHGQQRKESLLN